MKIEEAVRAVRQGKVCRCKNRYYTMIEGCLFRVYRRDPDEQYVRVYGVANIKGTDFLTEDWEITSLVLVQD